MTTIGESISRIRNLVKGSKQDPFLTDRFIYSLIIKYAKLFIKRQDALNIRLKFSSLYAPLSVKLKEVDKTEAACGSIASGCKIMRSIDKIPVPFEGSFGPFIRTVSSIDGSEEVYRTSPAAFTSMTKTSAFKYNKQKYYWYLNGYLYFPNCEWPEVSLEGIWQDDMSVFSCDTKDQCKIRQDQVLPVPDDLFAEIEKQVLQDLGFEMQVPADPKNADKQNILR